MSRHSPRSILTTLSHEIRLAGLDKTRTPVQQLDLIPKDQLVMLIVDLMDQYVKQTNFTNFAQFFISWSYKKYSIKLNTAKFVQSFEYSIEVHSKFYEELVFLQYLLNIDDGREVIKFYLRSRRILMSFFYGDACYHDAETTNMELEHWMNIATRVFTETPSPKSIERINNVLVRKAIQISNNSIRKTVDAVTFLEQCVLEYIRITNAKNMADKDKSPGRNVSPISKARDESPFKISRFDGSPSRSPMYQKENNPRTASRNASPIRPSTSPFRGSAKKGHNGSIHDSFIARFDLDSPGKYKIQKPLRKWSPEKKLNKNSVLIVDHGEGHYDVPDLYDHNNNFLASGTKDRSRGSTPDRSRSRSPGNRMTNHELRKDRRFLNGELTDQTNERNMIEEYLDKVLREFNAFSHRHDQVCDFTLTLQRNFLYVFEKIKMANSDLLEDEEVRAIYRRTASFNNYETNFVDKLQRIITPKDHLNIVDY